MGLHVWNYVTYLRLNHRHSNSWVIFTLKAVTVFRSKCSHCQKCIFTQICRSKEKTKNASMASCESSKRFFTHKSKSRKRVSFELALESLSHESSIIFIRPCRKVTLFITVTVTGFRNHSFCWRVSFWKRHSTLLSGYVKREHEVQFLQIQFSSAYWLLLTNISMLVDYIKAFRRQRLFHKCRNLVKSWKTLVSGPWRVFCLFSLSNIFDIRKRSATLLIYEVLYSGEPIKMCELLHSAQLII